MDRLTFEGNFCDISLCLVKECKTVCSQKEVWERLKAYEDTGLSPEEVPTVVRCVDCKHQEDCIRRIQFWVRNPVLELNTTKYHPIDFCSYGELRGKE